VKRAALFSPIVLALLIVSIAAIVSIAVAQTGGGYDVSWSTIDSGGDAASGGGYTLDHTLGQFDAGVQSDGGYTVEGGFWQSANVNYRVFLPIMVK
jgi:hypothetical protein